jgi:hypothetical protein
MDQPTDKKQQHKKKRKDERTKGDKKMMRKTQTQTKEKAEVMII